MKEKLVSIIMPSYNSAKFISDSIFSIQQQTYNNWELIITDDCSSDNTIEIIKTFQKEDLRIKLLVLSSNAGAGVARNNSIKFAKGRFIAFCDSDDKWKKEKLTSQLQFMEKYNLSLTYSGYDSVDSNGNFERKINVPKTITYSKILKNNYFGCLTVVYDVKLIGKRYMPKIRKRQDWALWINILRDIEATKGMQDSLAIYNNRLESISSNKFNMLIYTWRIYKYELGFNYMTSMSYMIIYLFYFALKKVKHNKI